MAITVNSSGYNYANSSTTCTVGLNIGAGTNTFLHVMVIGVSVATFTGVTWQGGALTAGDVRTINGPRKAYHFYGAAPATGSGNVVATVTASDDLYVVAVAADGVAQSSTIRGYADAYTDPNASYALTPSGNLTGDLLIAIISDISATGSAFAAASGSTEAGTPVARSIATYRVTDADTQSTGCTWTGGTLFVQACSVALKPVSGGGGASSRAGRQMTGGFIDLSGGTS